jgi:hypothetical protein
MASFTDRMLGAARLDVRTYEEVEADKTATTQAMLVVVGAGLATAIGSSATEGIRDLVVSTVFSLVGWYVWAFVTFAVGTRLFPEPQTRANVGELLRTTGFSAAPGLLRVFGIVPLVGTLLFVITLFWMLASFIVAVRQALDYESTGRAIVVCVIGWLFFVAFSLAAWFFRGILAMF